MQGTTDPVNGTWVKIFEKIALAIAFMPPLCHFGVA